ncbi:glycosyl transferase [Bacillus pseudomycoides]|nr:glycosyl transferase [Bacillus pseudomycoides]
MLTSIVMLTHNQLHYTKQCIDSIRKYTKKESYELIVIDNASTDGTIEWLQLQSDILLMKNTTNVGFPRGCNQGIEKAKGDNILLLNNDVVVTENWLTNLLACLYEQPDTAAVGPVTNSASYYSTIPVPYTNIEEMQKFAAMYNQSDATKWEERIKLIGFCMLIKRAVLNEIGLLDERFTPGNYEDDDLSLRMRQKGYKLYLCRDTFVHHYGSVSWKENIPQYSALLYANALKFQQKWGFPSSDLFIRFDLLQLSDMYYKEGMNILHIGAGCGATLLEMKWRYRNGNFFGVEEKKEAVNIAEYVAPTLHVKLNELEGKFSNEKFSIILLSCPVYREHMVAVIRGVSRLLHRDGFLIMSFPNSNYYTRIEQRFQLQGENEEAEQSYNLAEIMILLEKEQLKVIKIQELGGDLGRWHEQYASFCNSLIGRIDAHLAGYSLIVSHV